MLLSVWALPCEHREGSGSSSTNPNTELLAGLTIPGGWEEGTEIRLASDENLSACPSFSRRGETLRKCLLFVSDSGSMGVDPYADADAAHPAPARALDKGSL